MAFAAASLPLILTAVSTVVGVAGAVVSANAAQQSANYQAQIAERNRQVMELNAQRSITAAQEEQLRTDETTRALLGQQIAAQSASGLSIGGKSQMLTRKSARMLGRMDALNVRAQGEVDAYNFRVAAQDAGDASKFYKSTGQNAMLAGFLEGTGVVLGGLGSVKQSQWTSLLGGTKATPSLRLT